MTKALVKPDFGNGSTRYSDTTLREYARRVRWTIRHYYHVINELQKLEARYQKILNSRHNEKV